MGKNQIIPGDTLMKIPARKQKSLQKGAPLPKKFVKKPMSQKYVVSRQKAQEALRFKRAGFSWAYICENVGYNHESTAYAAVKRELQRSARIETQDWIAMHMERTEEMLKRLQDGMRQGNPRSIEVGVKVLERQAEMLGLDYEDRKEQATQAIPVQINILADPRDSDAQRFLADIAARAITVDATPVHRPVLPPAEGDTQH